MLDPLFVKMLRPSKELPEKIDRLERRIATLDEDIAMAQVHEHDPVTIDGRPRTREDIQEAIAATLQSVPIMVFQHRRIPHSAI